MLSRKRKQTTVPEIKRTEIRRVYAAPELGLNTDEVNIRRRSGWANTPVEPPTKTRKQIVLGHLLTYFNLIFFILASSVILVGQWRELGFIVIIVANIVCGIIQELNSKRIMDKMTFLTSPKGTVVRDGVQQTLPTEQLVLDDVVVFGPGDQIYADATVVAGSVQVNEALITGEADEIKKEQSDSLLSGSFILSGKCHARLTHVGADSYVSKLSMEAKKGNAEPPSVMMRSLNRLIIFVGIVLIPIGILQVFHQFNLSEQIDLAVVHTVAILVGMIPEGLYLLATAALALSVVRLARQRVLVQRMRCIETLARVDVLCVDKTGTITENKMTVKDVVLLSEDRFVEDDIRLIMSDYVGNMSADNETMVALQKYFTGTVMQRAIKTLPFSSARKYGGVSYAEDETYLLGAPEFILGASYIRYREAIEHYSALGCRVLLLALYDGDLTADGIYGEVMPLSLILLTNKIRAEAPSTFAYFAEQGVTVKVISGDNPVTVAQVAKDAGIQGADAYVDATTLNNPQAIYDAARNYTVFGRVRPEQKRSLIRALKAQGHTVAMTGDGVNDVLALKDADCSIAMASGADVAARVSQLVLLESDFSAMPSVVDEGRRVINNIERSASLFLVRNIFSFILAIITLLLALPLPLQPMQMSLIGGLTIGIPSFVLALEGNFKRIEGKFLLNVIVHAFPAAMTNVILISGTIVYSLVFELSDLEMSTMSVYILSTVGVLMLYRISRPFNRLRGILFAGVVAGLAFSFAFLRNMFSLSPLGLEAVLLLVVFLIAAYPIMWGIHLVMERVSAKWRELFARGRRRRGRT